MKRIAMMMMTVALPLAGAVPARAAEPAASPEPVTLADDQLDQVTAGAGSLLDLNLNVAVLLKNIDVAVNISNVPVNAGVAVQANVLGEAIQNATVVVGQQVTQGQSLALH
jgi:biotin carboxyl carrier protein